LNGFFISSDISNNKNDESEIKDTDLTPEDLARKCALKLLEELFYCGAVDTHHQGLFLLLMSLSNNNNISKLKLGRISQHTMGLLRLIHKLLGVKFKIEEIEKDDYDEEVEDDDMDVEDMEDMDDDEEDKLNKIDKIDKVDKVDIPNRLMFSCVGIGLKNIARIEL
jgi:transcriptional regulator with XRE-family HTH domain